MRFVVAPRLDCLTLYLAHHIQMIVADEAHQGYHRVHAGGIAALLRTESSPLGLLKVIQFGHPLLTSGMSRVRFLKQ